MNPRDVPASPEIGAAATSADVAPMVAPAEQLLYERVPFNLERGLGPGPARQRHAYLHRLRMRRH